MFLFFPLLENTNNIQKSKSYACRLSKIHDKIFENMRLEESFFFFFFQNSPIRLINRLSAN